MLNMPKSAFVSYSGQTTEGQRTTTDAGGRTDISCEDLSDRCAGYS